MNNTFLDDREKMIDFYGLTKSEFLKSYSYLTESEYDATKKIHSKLCKLWKKYDLQTFEEKAAEVATLNEIEIFLESA